MTNYVLIVMGLAFFAYGMYLPGLTPGIYFTMLGGLLVGAALSAT